jgi:hypothetical protein
VSVPPLPTSAEAMREAVMLAKLRDFDGGRLWLDIARELRTGSRPAAPFPRMLEREGPPEVLVEDVTEGLPDCAAGYYRGQIPGPSRTSVSFARARLKIIDAGGSIAHVDERSLLEEILSRAPAEYAGEQAPVRRMRTADTAVMRIMDEPQLPRCVYCDNALVWVTPGPETPDRVPHWSHVASGQTVCPATAEGRSHTFATPSVDERG